ncbi:MAG: hypothetical protein MPK62_00055 [Alphaproteobacteria bacterium]|nr:hypothetical protein [Alphaproteobacteria bacterium]MDA8029529.1 hypothetical protein [Alphaproteobacteria bacterium]
MGADDAFVEGGYMPNLIRVHSKVVKNEQNDTIYNIDVDMLKWRFLNIKEKNYVAMIKAIHDIEQYAEVVERCMTPVHGELISKTLRTIARNWTIALTGSAGLGGYMTNKLLSPNLEVVDRIQETQKKGILAGLLSRNTSGED